MGVRDEKGGLSGFGKLAAGLLLVILLKPTLLGQIAAVNRTLQVLSVVLFAVLILRAVLQGRPVSVPFMLLAGYRAVLLIPTLANGGDVAAWTHTTSVQLGLLLLVESYAAKGRQYARDFLGVISSLLLLYLAINQFSIMSDFQSHSAWGNGFTQTTYFLGIRTRVTDVVIPAILLSHLHDRTKGRRGSLRTLLILALGAWQIIHLGVATAIVGAGVIALVYGLYRIAPWLRRLVSMRALTLMGLLLSALFVFARLQESEFVASIVSDSLGKSVTLTGRTEIWAHALPIVFQAPFLGHGVDQNFGAFVPWAAGRLWQAHSQYLQLAYDSGFLGVAIFVAFLLSAAARFDRSQISMSVRAAFLSAYAAFMVMSVSEIYTYNMGLFFLLPFIASQIEAFCGSGKSEGSRLLEWRNV